MANVKRSWHSAKRKRIKNAKECKFEMKHVLVDLFECFHRALSKYNNLVNQIVPEARVRGYEATLFNSLMIESVESVFKHDWLFGKYKRFILRKNEYLILFKKLDKKGKPMYIKTKISEAIQNQIEGDLFGSTDNGCEPIIYFGYKKNSIGDIVDPQIVYMDDGNVKWTIKENELERGSFSMVPVTRPNTAGYLSVRQGIMKKGEKSAI